MINNSLHGNFTVAQIHISIHLYYTLLEYS